MDERGRLRMGAIALALFSIVLGLYGFAHMPGADGHVYPFDVVYYTLQLFTLGAEPLQKGAPYPPAIEVARLTAPMVTFYALFDAGSVLFATEIARRRVRRVRGHAIVCGDSPLAAALTQRLSAQGQRVVCVREGGPAGSSSLTSLVVRGDAREPGVLREAGIGRATAIFVCTEDSADNIAVAFAATEGEPRRPFAVYAHVRDPRLCLALQARHLGANPAADLRLDFFNSDDLAARAFWTHAPIQPVADQTPRLLIVSASAFGRSIIVEAARQWWTVSPSPSRRMQLTVVDPAASERYAHLTREFPFLAEAVEARTLDGDVNDFSTEISESPVPDRTFVCDENELVALTTAMTADVLWRGGPASLVVRLDQLAGLQTALEKARRHQLFDEISDKLLLYGVVDAAADPALIRDDLSERLARVMHESYLVARRAAADGELATTMDLRALVAWADLADQYKRGNRTLAADVGRKLRTIGCALAPRLGAGADHELSPPEVESLAQAEHARWVAERAAEGWQHGAVRDEAEKRNPSLTDWAQLADDHRELNRMVIRQLPTILGWWGMRIVRR